MSDARHTTTPAPAGRGVTGCGGTGGGSARHGRQCGSPRVWRLVGCLLLALLALPGQAQISPGALSRAHAQFEGMTRCTTCHDLAARTFKCLDCHTEIQSRVAAGSGFHARAFNAKVGQTDCARCHAEHRGAGVALIDLDRKNFDHLKQTGFALQGKHRAASCESCHNSAKISQAGRTLIKLRDTNRSFLGLSKTCTSCHQEPHQQMLGAKCEQCHSPEKWKPASGFDHSKARFPVTGIHVQVACDRCHTATSPQTATRTTSGSGGTARAPASLDLRFRGLTFTGCQSCHDDRHRGEIGRAPV